MGCGHCMAQKFTLLVTLTSSYVQRSLEDCSMALGDLEGELRVGALSRSVLVIDFARRQAKIFCRDRIAMSLLTLASDSEPTSIESSLVQLPTDTNGVGLSNASLNLSRRKLLDLVNKLISTGVQVDIDLPQIAVIGNQSAGKSSLIEAISGITLPRASGTCTRCPTECRLSKSDTRWQCVVSLRRTTDQDGQALGQAQNEPFGGIIYDKSLVEDRVRRAQLSILNPDKAASVFLDGDYDDSTLGSNLTFSKNCVTLQISGPDVADLSFCDLPGLIASQTGSRGKNDIALVESLVTSYIEKPSCIILLTVACETDFENQGAHQLAKTHDTDGRRTVGVLTKPDRIPTGEEAIWLPYIRNEKVPLENNWFCVKQPSSSDLKANITWERAREMEGQFFSSTRPWSDLEHVYQKYLHTKNLVERLSSILSDLIARRLPQIQEELEKASAATRNNLIQLPKKPSDDPRSEISTLLHDFTSDVARHVEGVPISTAGPFAKHTEPMTGSPREGLIQDIIVAQEKFHAFIRATAPNFRPFEKKDAQTKHLHSPAFLRLEEGDRFEDEMSDVEGSSDPTIPRKKKTISPSKIYIDEVLEVAATSRTRELSGHFPFVVQTMFIKNIVEKWRTPALHLTKVVYDRVLEHLQWLVSKHFQIIGQGHLETRVNYILLQHMKRRHAEAELRINWLIELEMSPFSLNTQCLSNYRAKFLAFYKGAREKYENGELVKLIKNYDVNSVNPARHSMVTNSPQPIVGIAKALAGLSEIGLTGVKAEDLPNLLPPDRMAPALGIMADVRSYFQVSYKRFTDNVPLAIDAELVRGAEKGMLQLLYSTLGINGPDGLHICRELSQESPHIADRRSDLLKKLERLENASHELLALGT